MNNNVLKILECCKTKDFKHFAKDASSLSCGHLICKECIPSNNDAVIKCDLCGDNNLIKLESLVVSKETHACTFLFNEYIKSIFNEASERLSEALAQFKEIRSKEYIDFRFNFMKEEIDLKVESLKCELDSLREKIFDQVDALKNTIEFELNSNNVSDKINEHHQYFEILKNANNCDNKKAREMIFECQDKMKNVLNDNRNYLNKNFKFAFVSSDVKINLEIIGEILRRSIDMDSLILDESQKEDLLRLCELPENKSYNLIYRATRDGFKASDFHRLCDNYSGTLVVIKSQNKYIFGGYTSQTWNHTGGYKSYVDEFLFSLTNPSNKPVKINISNVKYAISCNLNYGPTFGGGHDIHVCSDSNTYNGSYSNLGHSYNGSADYFTGSRHFLTTEIEVFHINK